MVSVFYKNNIVAALHLITTSFMGYIMVNESICVIHVFRKGINFRGGFNFSVFVGFCFMTSYLLFHPRTIKQSQYQRVNTVRGHISYFFFLFTLKYFFVNCLLDVHRKRCAMLSNEERQVYNEEVEKGICVFINYRHI